MVSNHLNVDSDSSFYKKLCGKCLTLYDLKKKWFICCGSFSFLV